MVNESDRMALFAISMLPSRRVAGTPLGTLQDVEDTNKIFYTLRPSSEAVICRSLHMVHLLILEKTLREEGGQSNSLWEQAMSAAIWGACSNMRTLMLACVILESFI